MVDYHKLYTEAKYSIQKELFYELVYFGGFIGPFTNHKMGQ